MRRTLGAGRAALPPGAWGLGWLRQAPSALKHVGVHLTGSGTLSSVGGPPTPPASTCTCVVCAEAPPTRRAASDHRPASHQASPQTASLEGPTVQLGLWPGTQPVDLPCPPSVPKGGQCPSHVPQRQTRGPGNRDGWRTSLSPDPAQGRLRMLAPPSCSPGRGAPGVTCLL